MTFVIGKTGVLRMDIDQLGEETGKIGKPTGTGTGIGILNENLGAETGRTPKDDDDRGQDRLATEMILGIIIPPIEGQDHVRLALTDMTSGSDVIDISFTSCSLFLDLIVKLL